VPFTSISSSASPLDSARDGLVRLVGKSGTLSSATLDYNAVARARERWHDFRHDRDASLARRNLPWYAYQHSLAFKAVMYEAIR